MDILRLDPLLLAFRTRKLEVADLGSSDVADGGLGSSDSVLVCEVRLEGPQPHVCFRGIAAVTVPQVHGFDVG
jgi:hypothetical protein